MNSTFNRGKLKRLAADGRLEMVEGYSFDDMTGGDRVQKIMPVKLVESVKDAVEGICCLRPDHFNSKSGCAYRSGTDKDGYERVCLIVHSNLNYEFRIKPEEKEKKPEAKPEPAPETKQDNTPYISNKVMRCLLDIDMFLHEEEKFVTCKFFIDGLYDKKSNGAASESDLKLIEVMELHTGKLLTLLKAIGKSVEKSGVGPIL